MLRVPCIGWKSTYKTKTTCLAIYVCATDVPNLLLHVSALHICNHQGVFTALKVVFSKWSVVCSTVTKLHIYRSFMGSFSCVLIHFSIHVQLFDLPRAVHRNIISIIKPTIFTNVSNSIYFGMTLYMIRTDFTSIIRSSRLYIQQRAFVKQILLCVQSWTPHNGRKDCPKHVECHSKIK